ncbi:MAG: pyridoxamine 5'-phosphate oxidase family protein [Armatimonadota bacterium]|nr:pyridoxamine 5'-phosphate oxidase family protein [Armatimonadota bacterium]MDR7454301.1 pyridoxamine 5'-phosphate oxidase family protein [Armatimonadota bacterium]MDR7511830.1 pyridoxamine 5'-phosphate oxidase family protein [Armatimonadota bacterium]
MARTMPALPVRAVAAMQDGCPAVLVTVGADGWGHAVMTWALALDAGHVRFAADHGTVTLANLERTGRAALQVIAAADVLVLVKGEARQVRARIAAAPFAMAAWELVVREVRDQTFAGVTVTPLAFEWTGPRAAALREVERRVLAELREEPGGR